MSELIKRLRDRRANVWEQAKALADGAAEENRSFSGEEERQWQEANAELDALDTRIKAVLDGEARAKATEEQFDAIHGQKRSERRREPVSVGGRDSGGGGEGGDVGSELRAFLRGEQGRTYTVAPTQGIDFRTLVKGTNGTNASAIVPVDFYGRLVQHLIETSGVMQCNPTVLNTSSGETIQVPKTTAHYTAAIVTEASAIGASESTFGQVSLGAYKYGALFQISRELLDDSGVDLEGYLAQNAGRALGNAMGNHFITGDGSAKPSGILAGATGAVTGATGMSGAPNTDNLIDLYYSVISPYRASRSCAWLMSDTTVGKVRKLKDTAGSYIWQPSMVLGTPDTIMGKPVFTDPYVATAATGAKSVIFGDFSQYFIRLAGGVRFERSDEYSFDKDLVTFRALLRADGAMVDLTGALKYFQGNAAV